MAKNYFPRMSAYFPMQQLNPVFRMLFRGQHSARLTLPDDSCPDGIDLSPGSRREYSKRAVQ
jgi:hypothetical protein